LETEPAARDNNTIFTLKTDDQTFVATYSTDNRSNFLFVFLNTYRERFSIDYRKQSGLLVFFFPILNEYFDKELKSAICFMLESAAVKISLKSNSKRQAIDLFHAFQRLFACVEGL